MEAGVGVLPGGEEFLVVLDRNLDVPKVFMIISLAEFVSVERQNEGLSEGHLMLALL